MEFRPRTARGQQGWQGGGRGGWKQRALLALLLLNPNEVLSRDRLIDALWGESPPPTAAKMLHNYVSQLRRALGGDGSPAGAPRPTATAICFAWIGASAISTASRSSSVAGGAFGRMIRRRRRRFYARRLPSGAVRRLPTSPSGFRREEIARLEELHLTALEERIEADLALGRHAELVAELASLVEEIPCESACARS